MSSSLLSGPVWTFIPGDHGRQNGPRRWEVLASPEENKRAAELEAEVRRSSDPAGPLTSGFRLINDPLRQCGDEHTRGSSYTAV